MKRSDITRINDMARRAPVAGRIRLGVAVPVPGKRDRPKSLDVLRFTSPQRELIEQCAAQFGGVVAQWEKQWEVITTSSEVPVLLAEDGVDQSYELWTDGGCQRRCDGEFCQVNQAVSDYDYEQIEVPCMCIAANLRSCVPKTRLTVILPTLSFAGTWRLDTSGWNAMAELPGMAEMIMSLAERGQMVRAVLGVRREEKVVPTNKGAQTRSFVVPFLRIEENVHELMAGGSSVRAISAHGEAAQRPALPSGAPSTAELPAEPEFDVDGDGNDDVADAEIMDDELVEIEGLLESDAKNFGLDPRRYVDAVTRQVEGDRARMRECSRRVRAGEIVPLGLASGKVQWKVGT